jgi:hypothetical protein
VKRRRRRRRKKKKKKREKMVDHKLFSLRDRMRGEESRRAGERM